MMFLQNILFLTLTLGFELPEIGPFNEFGYGQELKRSGRMEAAALCKANQKIIDPDLFVKHMICRNPIILNFLKSKVSYFFLLL